MRLFEQCERRHLKICLVSDIGNIMSRGLQGGMYGNVKIVNIIRRVNTMENQIIDYKL